MYKDFYNNKLVPFVNKVRMACNVGEIPLVFDNSLTYYEQIAAFSAKLNDVISTVNVQSLTLCEFMQQLTEAFKELSDDFAEQWAEIQTAFVQLRGRVNVLDERVTALENLPLGVGMAIPEGTEYIEPGEDPYIAGLNAEVFNCYEDTESVNKNRAAGDYSHAEGVSTKAYATASHCEGSRTTALKSSAHAEGMDTTADGLAAHAGGRASSALNAYAFAHGNIATASGEASTAFGSNTAASGTSSFAEGDGAHALGLGSHAGGKDTVAEGNYSRAFGEGTKATRDNSLAFGKYNVEDTDGEAVLIIGNGTAEADRSDLFKILADGKFQFGNYPPFSPFIDHKSMYDTGVVISNTTDLNTLAEPGKYFASDIINMPNKPAAIQGGSATIKVEYIGRDYDHSFYLQTLMNPLNGVYQRFISPDSSTFTTWKLTFNPYS